MILWFATGRSLWKDQKMAGKRMLHANICESKKLSEISFAAETLYYRLLSRVDDDGNFSADPRIVLGQCAPLRRELDEKKVQGLLDELASCANGEKKPLIQFYTKEGDKCLHITRFEDFQYLRPDRPAVVKFPTHPAKMGTSLVNQRYTNGLPNGDQMETADAPKLSEEKLSKDEENVNCDFRIISRRYRILMHKPSGKDKNLKLQYAEACEKYGEELVMAAFEEWAEANQWKTNKPGLFFFFKDAPEIIEELEVVRKVEIFGKHSIK